MTRFLKLRRYSFAMGILIVGVGLSIATFSIVRNWEHRRVREELLQQVDNLATTLTYNLEDKLEAANVIAAFYNASNQIDRREFQTFVRPILSRYEGIYGLSWVAKVTAAQRRSYEQAIAAEGFPNFSIYHRDDAGRITPPKQQTEYFPITYTQPSTLSKAIGYDMLSEPIRRATLERARQTASMAITERVNLVDNEPGVVAFQPVYAQQDNPAADNLQGFTQVVFSLKQMVETPLANLNLRGIDFTLYDTSASTARQFLVRYQSKTQELLADKNLADTPSSKVAKILCNTSSDCVRYLKVADRTWMLVVTPAPAYTNLYTYWQSESVLVIGLLLTIGFVVYFLITQRYTERIENLVHERTAQAQELSHALADLQQTQTHLIQTEKMSSLGQLVAGVAHEINNPVNFIHGNLDHVTTYTQDLLGLVTLYQRTYPQSTDELQSAIEDVDLDFLTEDLPRLLKSMQVGTDRIRQIVLSLRNFSRLDEADMKAVNIHEGIDSTILILQNRLKDTSSHVGIKIVKNYGDLPLVECYAGQLNQVFMNILGNAIDALEESFILSHSSLAMGDEEKKVPTIQIHTELITDSYAALAGQSHINQESASSVPAISNPLPLSDKEPMTKDKGKRTINQVRVRITDNGSGMTEEVQRKLFDPFFTTKPVGKGTGLGLAISYQIVTEKHGGNLWCESSLGAGTTFFIEVPVSHPPQTEKLAEPD